MKRTQAVAFFKGVTLAGIYAGLLLPLIFIPVVIFPFVFSKLVFFQVVIGLSFPAYIALAWMEPKYRPPKHLLYTAILAYFAALILSVIFAVDPMRAWWGNQERMNGLFTILHFFAWLTMAVGVLKTWEDWRKLLNYEIALSGIMAVVAIMQKFNPNLLLFPAGPRVGGLLDNPIYMAAYQIFNLFFLALLFWKVQNRNWRIFYGFIGALDLIAFILAQSRGALVGLVAGVVAFVIYVGLFSKSKKVRIGVVGALLAMVLGYGLLYAAREVPIIKESPLYRLTDFRSSVTTRLIAWEIAWEGFLERPLTGWGFDNFHILFNQKYNPQSLRFGSYETWFDRAHNTVLDVLSMTGLLGFLTFAGIYIALFWSTLKAYRKSWIDLPIAAILFSLPVAYFVQNLFVFDHPAGFSMSYLLFALVIAATKGEFVGKHEEVPAAGTKEAPWVLFGVTGAAMLLLVWRTSILPFQVSRISIRSNQTIAYNPQAGLTLAKQAAAIWTPYLDEQSFLLSRNLIGLASNAGGLDKVANWQDIYSLAKELSLKEIARHPRNTHPRFILARTAQAVSTVAPEEAAVSEEQYLAAIETSPKRQQLHYGLGRLYIQLGQVDKALEVFRRVRDFDLELGEGHWNYGLALTYDKRDYVNGAREILASQTAAYPYQPADIREIIPLADMVMILNDASATQVFLDRLPLYPVGPAELYAQIAYKFFATGMTDVMEAVLSYGETVAPTTRQAFEAFKQSQTKTSTSTTSGTSATSTSSGPRR